MQQQQQGKEIYSVGRQTNTLAAATAMRIQWDFHKVSHLNYLLSRFPLPGAPSNHFCGPNWIRLLSLLGKMHEIYIFINMQRQQNK